MPYVKAEIDRRRKGSAVKNIWLRFRCSQEERELYKRMAAERGVSMSEMIRSFLFQDGDNENKSR